MAISTVFANLRKLDGGRLSIEFEAIPQYSTRDDHEPPAKGIGICMLVLDTVLADVKGPRALSKAGQAAAKLAYLLNTCYHENGSLDRLDDGRLYLRVGNKVLVVDETFKSEPIHTHSWNLFIATEFHFPTVASSSTHYLQISLPIIKHGETLFSTSGEPLFEHIEIVSGVCTFNGSHLIHSIEDPRSGKINVNQLKHVTPTFHEMDYIARSSSVIADVAAMIILRVQEQRSSRRVSIKLDVPSWHFYHSAVAAFEIGKCSAIEALRWMDAVDQRHDQIGQVFTESVQHELRTRGIHNSSSYEIHTSSRTNVPAVSIRTEISDS